MTLGSWSALALTSVAFAVYWALPARWRPWVLTAFSYAFYTFAFPAHAVLLAILTVGAYVLGKRIRELDGPPGRRWLFGGVAASLSVLALFKYAAFIVEVRNAAWARLGLGLAVPVPDWAAPLGISFVTFGLIHYLVEMRRGEAPVPTFAEFAAYVSFFPTVASGPIKRYPEFVSDSRTGRERPRAQDVAYGIWRILLGVFRKFVVADTIGVLATPLFEVQTTTPLIVIAVYAYAFKIYFDFAGYSDIAIGTARLFGFNIIENFNAPYLRRNLSEFWRNWHASLTRFITEYIYIPLGGNRRGAVRVVVNTLVTMGLSGLWHGAAGHFIAWGLWHGAGLVVLRLWRSGAKALRCRVGLIDRFAGSGVGRTVSYAFGWMVTFQYVVFGWVLFVLPVRDSITVYRAVAGYALQLARSAVAYVL